MICQPCKAGTHETCAGEKQCPCQHRIKSTIPEEEQ